MTNETKKPVCANCGKEFVATKEGRAFLPFCSKRCKMIDLGLWLSEKYVVEDKASSPPKKDDNE